MFLNLIVSCTHFLKLIYQIKVLFHLFFQMDYVKPDPLPDPSKIKEHNDKYLESLNSGFGGAGSGMGPPTPMGMGPPTPMAMSSIPMAMDLVSTHFYFTFLNHRKMVFCYQNYSNLL